MYCKKNMYIYIYVHNIFNLHRYLYQTYGIDIRNMSCVFRYVIFSSLVARDMCRLHSHVQTFFTEQH